MRILCKIELPVELPTPNQLLRMHWRQRHKLKGEYTLLLKAAGANEKRYRSGQEKRKISIISYRKKQMRDPDNLYFTAKILLDSIRDVGLIWDDSMKFINLSVSQETDKENPRTEVIVYVLDDSKNSNKGGDLT